MRALRLHPAFFLKWHLAFKLHRGARLIGISSSSHEFWECCGLSCSSVGQEYRAAALRPAAALAGLFWVSFWSSFILRLTGGSLRGFKAVLLQGCSSHRNILSVHAGIPTRPITDQSPSKLKGSPRICQKRPWLRPGYCSQSPPRGQLSR